MGRCRLINSQFENCFAVRGVNLQIGFGWGGRIRTYECGNQNPVPYRLATPQREVALNKYGAGDKFRTCYLQSHNLALYRLSYARHISCAPKELLYRRYAQPACTGWAKRSFLSPHFLVRPERLEPPTHGLEGRCSILLSYGRVMHIEVALKA